MSNKKLIPEIAHSSRCIYYTQRMLALRDAMELLSGKWKVPIICTLSFRGKMRFSDLIQEVEGIAAKMLSKELQILEANELITRTVCNTKPVTVEYEITEYGKTLDKILVDIVNWGHAHRNRIMPGQASKSIIALPLPSGVV